ncbi:MAG: hypothetical protein Ct9H300mP12_02350 [Acidimicrobiales bacterium]|nr:MAG: hypothetical protein Ct9H300mP12_02350 [Acidimicrobiales bacterium]
MMTNHLPGAGDLDDVGDPLYAPGFFSAVDSVWGSRPWRTRPGVDSRPPGARLHGVARPSTVFWVDPVEGVHCIFLTQMVPSSVYASRRWDLRALVNQALGG